MLGPDGTKKKRKKKKFEMLYSIRPYDRGLASPSANSASRSCSAACAWAWTGHFGARCL